MGEQFIHRSVLLDECIDALNIKPEGTYLDGTLGRAGHSLEIVKRLTSGRLICIDRDDAAIEAAKVKLADYLDRVTLVHGNFHHLDDILNDLGNPPIDGMLFDLGVSSPSWTMPAVAFPTWRTPLWTCAWTARRPSPPTWW